MTRALAEVGIDLLETHVPGEDPLTASKGNWSTIPVGRKSPLNREHSIFKKSYSVSLRKLINDVCNCDLIHTRYRINIQEFDLKQFQLKVAP